MSESSSGNQGLASQVRVMSRTHAVWEELVVKEEMHIIYKVVCKCLGTPGQIMFVCGF